MRTLILAAGRFGDEARGRIAEGREPRLDVFEIAATLGADIIDFADVEKSRRFLTKGIARSLGLSAAVAGVGFGRRRAYDAVLTTGEDIGIPLALSLKASTARCSHTMIAHTLSPRKKRVFFDVAHVETRMDHIFVYSTSEERHVIDRLGVPASKVERIYYHADTRFFRPLDKPLEPDLICAAGQLLRDYDCLVDAVRDLPLRVQIAAGSPWIERPLAPRPALPANVTWGSMKRFELRDLYARAALAVVPILQNDYQTGIATILEMMSMGKCVIATRTRGQTDTIVDGVTGIYVPPGDPIALRTAITRMLASPEQAQRIGAAARRFVEEQASLDHFVERVVAGVRTAHEVRFGS